MNYQKKLIVEIQGGLGNQLFGLAFAIYLSKLQCRAFAISDRQIDRGITKHGVRISEFVLPIEFLTEGSKARQVDRIQVGFRRRIRETLGVALPDLSNTYYSPTVGFDPSVDASTKTRFLGYFQSHVYASALREFLGEKPLQVVDPSNWYLDMRAEALESRPLMMHVRRGDYLKVKQQFGTLSSAYYANALKVLGAQSHGQHIWIFSDSPEMIDSRFMREIEEKATLITPPKGIRAAESLALMQYGSSNIISNSTFSWWSAYLSASNAGRVIFPKDWFLGMANPEKLMPADWIGIESQWE